MARQGRGVVLVNAGVSAVIVAVIAGVSVFRSPPAPPTVQEFAPANPGRHITAEASDQPAGHGTPLATGPLSRPTGRGVPSALQCWSWPDGSTTQTFDRQSPPCISSWEVSKGNGGATSRGVTRTEVRVGVPASSVAQWQPYATFFSRHYQLYGRTIRLVPLGLHDLATAEGQRSAAATAAEAGVFAALDDVASGDGRIADPGVYLDTLASHRVVGVLTASSQVSTTALAAQAPYAWSVQPALDTTQRALGTTICRELAGHTAQHSPETKGQNRRFLALVPAAKANAGQAFAHSALDAVLESCHVDATVREYDPADRLGLEQLMAQARRDLVTTLVPFGPAAVVAAPMMLAGQRVGYHPEWFLPGFTDEQSERVWGLAPPEQSGALFGLAAWGRPLPESRRPAVQALDEVAPAASFDASDQQVYDGLALIAAGLQLAGPRPTAQAFAGGLETTSFPNPGAGQAPDHQPSVGFEDLDHALVDDVGQVWWDRDRFCFVGGGRRWTADELDYADPGFFNSARGC